MNEQKSEEFDAPVEDVEGHKFKQGLIDDDEDVEGHRIRGGNNLTDDDEDVEGHRYVQVQPPRDTDLGGTDR